MPRFGYVFYSTRDEEGHLKLDKDFYEWDVVIQLDVLSDIRAEVQAEYEAAFKRFDDGLREARRKRGLPE